MKRFGLQFSLLFLLVMPLCFALGWWARDRDCAQIVGSLERRVADLPVQRHNDRLLDELQGAWTETSFCRDGRSTQWANVLEAGCPIDVEWLLAPEGGSQRSVLKGEVETLDLGKFTVDASKDPAWIDFHSRGGGRPFVCLGIVRVSYGYTDFGSATLALSPPSWDGDPKRPTSFEATPRNGVSVYQLER
jgi:hypothetical protein